MRLFFYAAVCFCLFFLACAGCQPRTESNQSALSLPTTKQVRIFSRDIPARAGAAPGSLHHKWTLLGERNWTSPTVTGLDGVLDKTYPLNDTQRKGGCHTWEYDLVAERIPGESASLHWTLTLHGSNGMTARSEGIAPLVGGTASVDAAVQIVEDRDSARGLPTEIVLARIGDKPVTLRVAS